MRILLTGKDGQVGWELERALAPLGEVLATNRTTLDLADFDAILRVVRQAKPEVIVNAAAYTAVDRAESEPELARRVNAEAPGVLAEEAKRLGALLVHYSSDYVFDGTKRTPYTEEDKPNPLSRYGRSKLGGEDAIRGNDCRYYVLRTSWVYGPRGKNLLCRLPEWLRAGQSLRVVADEVSVPTPAAWVARKTEQILLSRAGPSGVYHLVPAGEASRYEFARALATALGATVSIVEATSSEYRLPATRPRYSAMSSAYAARVFGVDVPGWESLLSLGFPDLGGRAAH